MNVDEFVQLVREYVVIVDRAEEVTPEAFLRSCAGVLPRIYAAGLELPDVDPTVDDVETDVDSPFDRLRSFLGRYDSYFEVFDPYVDEKPVQRLLSDDLADIYLDLVRPLAAFDAGHKSDAIWAWRSNLEGHAGDHLVGAMRPIQKVVYETAFEALLSDGEDPAG